MRARNGVYVPKNMLFFVLLSGMRAGSPVLSELILGREQGLVRRIGHLKSYRCASKNPGARVRIESARPKHVFCRRRETSVLALHHPRFGRKNGLPDRAYHMLSIRVEKPQCVP